MRSPSLRRTLAFGGAVLVVLAVVLAAAAKSEPSHRLTRVALFGDSLTYDAERYTKLLVDDTDRYDVRYASLPGTAICDWLPEIRGARDKYHPEIVVFQFVGNDILPCMRGPGGSKLSNAEYERRWRVYTQQAIELFSPKVRIDLIGAPAMQTTDNRVYDIWHDLAAQYPNTHFFDGGALVSPNRRFVKLLPCLTGEPCTGPIEGGIHTNVVRAWDGTHFCPIKTSVYGARCPVYESGAYRFALTEYEAITGRPAPAVAVLPPNLPAPTITRAELDATTTTAPTSTTTSTTGP